MSKTPSKALEALKRKIYEKYDEKCANPKCQNAPVDFHHIKYKSHQGKDAEDNLLPLCRKCHTAIHMKTLKIEEDWLK